ncbi:unnamed protein product [Closterium sp. NIES-53]
MDVNDFPFPIAQRDLPLHPSSQLFLTMNLDVQWEHPTWWHSERDVGAACPPLPNPTPMIRARGDPYAAAASGRQRSCAALAECDAAAPRETATSRGASDCAESPSSQPQRLHSATRPCRTSSAHAAPARRSRGGSRARSAMLPFMTAASRQSHLLNLLTLSRFSRFLCLSSLSSLSWLSCLFICCLSSRISGVGAIAAGPTKSGALQASTLLLPTSCFLALKVPLPPHSPLLALRASPPPGTHAPSSSTPPRCTSGHRAA